MKTLNDRIRLSLLHAETRMKEKELAEKLGKSQRWFSGVKKGQWKADKELREAAKILNVPEEWLLHGTGPAPTWAPKPPPEQESLQKSMDLLLKMFEEQQAELKVLRQEVHALSAQKTENYGPDTQKSTITGRIKYRPPLDDEEETPALKTTSKQSGA